MSTSHVRERCGRQKIDQTGHKATSEGAFQARPHWNDVENVQQVQQVKELRLHSDLPLYSLILQHDGLDLTNEVKGHESLEELLDEDGDLEIEDADSESTSTASASGNEEQNGLTLSSLEEQETVHFWEWGAFQRTSSPESWTEYQQVEYVIPSPVILVIDD